jgi:hypothetical protein
MRLDFFEKFLITAFVMLIGYCYRYPLIFIPVASEVLAVEREEDHSLTRARTKLAAEETARYINEHMSAVRSYADRYALFRDSVRAAKLDGLYCEFGVAQGASINFIADLAPSKTIHGFDSFEGLPESWRDGFGKGVFAIAGLPQVRKNVVLHKGWFDKTVPEFHGETSQPIAFVHMDADLYSSTTTVLEGMGDRLVPGTVIQFDEFFNYPGWKNGEFKAFSELVDHRSLTFSYIGYADQQVALTITAK